MTKNVKISVTCYSIFILILLLLGIPFTKWGFKTDDFSNLYHTSQVKNFHDVFRLFNDKSIETFCYPSGSNPPKSSFLSGLYRPVSFIYYLPQYYFFGTNAYGYYLTTIVFHALNSILLFLLFLSFLPYALALFGSLYFAFHPSLHNWLGWISAQTYQTELFVLLLLIFFLKKFFDTKTHKFYLLALFLYALNLWLKEATFMLPLWLIPATYFYLKTTQPQTFKTRFKKSLLASLGFWLVSISYFVSRALVFGFAPTGNTGNLTFEFTWTSFIARQKARVFDFVSYIVDMFGLCWLPGNNQLLKGALILGIIGMLLLLFFKSKKKLLLMFFYASTLLFSWPALLMHYQPRYIYLALPFFIGAVLISMRSIKHYLCIMLISCLISCNALFLFQQLKTRETALHNVTNSFTTLLNEHPATGKPLYFFALPHHWFAMCVAQAVWFLSGRDNYSVYHGDVIVEVAKFYCYLSSPVTVKPYLKISPVPDGFLLTSCNIQQLWLSDQQHPLRTASLMVTIDRSVLDQHPTFITWDYHHAKFIIIDHEHTHLV